MGTLFGLSLLTIVGCIVAVVLLAFFVLGIRFVPNNRVGIIEKRFGGRGSVESGLIALRGEAGFQPHVLRGGIHWLMPLQYAVHRMPLVTIPQGKVGYVFSRDGKPLEPTQTLGSNAQARSFEDVVEFLGSGGQRGPQRQILREGTYALNLAQFVVITEQMNYFLRLDREDTRIFDEMSEIIAKRGGFDPIVIKGSGDEIGIVTVHDGPALAERLATLLR